jgi:radical SAM superfamily enzyme YgiQ (UPF0313 family)
MIRKVVFVEPKSPDRHVFSRWKLPRLGTVMLATRLKTAGFDIKVFVEDVAPVDYETFFSADLVGISTITSTAPRAYEFARAARRAGIPVIMGGPHVTFLPDEALQHCDYAFRGEADDQIVNLVRCIESARDLKTFPSLSYHAGDTVVHNPRSLNCPDVDLLPMPDLSLVEGFGRIAKGNRVVPIQTSRGCPFDCTFCSVTKMFGRAYRFRSTENVMSELRAAHSRWIFFYDDNFTANRERAKELCHTMIRENLGIHWSAQVRCDAANDPVLLDLMAQAGCCYVYIGFESVNSNVLKNYDKRQSVEQMEFAIREFHDRHIRIHGMFIFGGDFDTSETFRETVRFARSYHLESAQFMILTPLPGTPVFDEMDRQGRLLSRDWSLYDAHHVVFEPKNMSPFELQVESLRAFCRFYSLGPALRRLIKVDFLSLVIKLWGRHAARQARRRLADYIEVTRQWAHKTGHRLELRARQTGEDIKIAAARFDPGGFRGHRQRGRSGGEKWETQQSSGDDTF